jgi:hypothetical protein
LHNTSNIVFIFGVDVGSGNNGPLQSFQHQSSSSIINNNNNNISNIVDGSKVILKTYKF